MYIYAKKTCSTYERHTITAILYCPNCLINIGSSRMSEFDNKTLTFTN